MKSTALLTTTGMRLLQIDRMLAGGQRVRLDSFLLKLHVSVATFKRDLQTLRQELGAPVMYDRFEKRYHLRPGHEWEGVLAEIKRQVWVLR